jgi:hypothetical protein
VLYPREGCRLQPGRRDIAFYGRVGALLAEAASDAVALDFGAGRGGFLDDPVRARHDVRMLRR